MISEFLWHVPSGLERSCFLSPLSVHWSCKQRLPVLNITSSWSAKLPFHFISPKYYQFSSVFFYILSYPPIRSMVLWIAFCRTTSIRIKCYIYISTNKTIESLFDKQSLQAITAKILVNVVVNQPRLIIGPFRKLK